MRSVGKYLARWGFTPQKPIKRAYEQSPVAVQEWLDIQYRAMEVFYLPSYSPELNPEERLNADLKRVIRSKVPVRTKARLQAAAVEHMTALETTPERIKSFFRDPFVKYAA